MEKDKTFRWQNLVMVAGGVMLNIALAKLALMFNLPLYLDSIGTLLVSATGGMLPGVVVGFVSNCINSVSDPITLYYGVISILLAVAASAVSRRGWLLHFDTAIFCSLIFTFVGGCLGSLLTWALYGLNLGDGASATLAHYFHNTLGFGSFASQLGADMAVDFADKLISTVVLFGLLKATPKKWMRELPNGLLYAPVQGEAEEAESRARGERFYRNLSLRTKLLLMIVSTAAVLSVMGVVISYVLYQRNSTVHYTELCQSAARLASMEVPAERVDAYLDGTAPDDEYQLVVKHLEGVRASVPNIEFIYVYQIREDGCHVVFDLDTPEVKSNKAGEVLGFDDAFQLVLPELLAGEAIEPIVSNASFGWLLSCYEPIYDADGACVAYAAADISMNDLMSDRMVFIIRMVSLFFGASTLIAAFAFWFGENKMVKPINLLATAAAKFAYDSEEQRRVNCQEMQELKIHTGDEIENLYNAVSKTTADASDYIDRINAQSSEIAVKAHDLTQLQDNMILCFADLVENRDDNTGGHIKRTAEYVHAIALELRREGVYAEKLTDAYIEKLTKSAPLHDIGKIRVTDAILNKPGKLTDEEYEIIKRHTTDGREILGGVYSGVKDERGLSMASRMAAYHHERWDGKGYPEGLRGDEIPLCARIMSVADVFDALVSKRSYKEPFPFDKAFGIIEECAGTQFDPNVAHALLSIRPQAEQIATMKLS